MMKTLIFLTTITCAVGHVFGPFAPSHRTNAVQPQQNAQLSISAEMQITDLIQDAIAKQQMPGCVFCFGDHHKIHFLKSFGNRQILPQAKPMETTTLFDLASLTKPIATATSIMLLVENDDIQLDDYVSRHLPEFGRHGKQRITIRQLLTHESGLIADNPLSDYEEGPSQAWEQICELKLSYPIGEKFVYSDVNFIVLAKLVERIAGSNISEFADSRIFKPLNMFETTFNPSPDLAARAAATEKRDGQWLQGIVHDPRAAKLNGIAGHAGLFSTANDLAMYAQALLQCGRNARLGSHFIRPETLTQMTRDQAVSSGIRGLGWDKQTGFSANKGTRLSDSAFGHGGFTGTVLWIDPERDLFFIFLSNRVHPNGTGSVNSLAGKLIDCVVDDVNEAQSDGTQSEGEPSSVRCGIDVLIETNFADLSGQRIGLVTNHTGRTADGTPTIDVFQNAAPQVELTAIFSPEHGFTGKLDQAVIGDSVEPGSELPIFSLYGTTRRPTPEMLENVDTLVFDIQDIGTRFYTYLSTMGESMLAAAEYDKRFVVLDRPNPIGGHLTTGPMLDAGSESFVGFHSLPIRHGMTLGELALMICSERNLDMDLHIIPCEGWKRDSYWEETGLLWTNPSPNMRSLTQAILYPGVGLIETTNVSVGRGTDTPFEWVGSPWLHARRVARALNARQIPGVACIPTSFTPVSGPYAREMCHAVRFQITNREIFDPILLGLELCATLHEIHENDWQTANLNRLLGNQSIYESLTRPTAEVGIDVGQLLSDCKEPLDLFLRRRSSFLLYEDVR